MRLARQGKTAEALDHLAGLRGAGFSRRQAHRGGRRPGLAQPRRPSSSKSSSKAGQSAEANGEAAGAKAKNGWECSVQPAADKDGQATLSEGNTAFDGRLRLLVFIFAIDDKAAAARPVVAGYGKAGELLAQWYKEGTAAGNHGDLYDNRDGGHSYMRFQTFPQLTRVIYGEESESGGT